ncbi:hypothetical protein A7K91_11125 [Paenibacillus oryzae]|uniref:Uncharacterized protein n=1 Tax=Paenibacillus oryzae TaxID=1844972 RepID=A0A1A5YU26_9BACL|nr:hypothetical protein A7K91_11125 [Paenibacillus oryzae]
MATTGCGLVGTTNSEEKRNGIRVSGKGIPGSGTSGNDNTGISFSESVIAKATEPSGSPGVHSAENPGFESATLLDQLQDIAQNAETATPIMDFITVHIEKADQKTADAMLSELQTFYARNLDDVSYLYYSIEEKLINKMYDYSLQWPVDENAAAAILDDEAREFILQLSMSGYKLGLAQGTFEPLIDYNRQMQFGKWLSETMNQYIEIEWIEAEQPFAKDGGLLISWDELAQRALRAESFLQKYPDASEESRVRELFDMYLNVYLGNAHTPNTLVYDYTTLKLNAEVRESYGETMKEFPDTVTAKLIAGLLETLVSTKDQLMMKDQSNAYLFMPAVKTFYDDLPSKIDDLLPTS